MHGLVLVCHGLSCTRQAALDPAPPLLGGGRGRETTVLPAGRGAEVRRPRYLGGVSPSPSPNKQPFFVSQAGCSAMLRGLGAARASALLFEPLPRGEWLEGLPTLRVALESRAAGRRGGGGGGRGRGRSGGRGSTHGGRTAGLGRGSEASGGRGQVRTRFCQWVKKQGAEVYIWTPRLSCVICCFRWREEGRCPATECRQ